MKKRYIILLFVLIFGLFFWILMKVVSAPTVVKTNNDVGILAPEQKPAQKDDLILVEKPLPGSKISSPLIISGKARGNWFFEASFPIDLTDQDGNIIVASYATTASDWMTTEYVPFTKSLNFVVPNGVTSGYLILKKDNPSGDPQYDNQLKIKVNF